MPNFRIAVLIIAMMFSSAHADIQSLNTPWLIAPNDASNFAAKIAASIKDELRCQKFKQEIMAHAKGSPTDGKTIAPIIEAKRKATLSGCAK